MSKSKNHGDHLENVSTASDRSPTTSLSSSLDNQFKADMAHDFPHRKAVICQPEHLGKIIYLDPTTEHLRMPYAEHGALVDQEPNDLQSSGEDLTWSKIRHYLREPFAEFWGVFILVMFGDGVVAQVTLSNGEKGDYQSISWGWGLGVMLGVYAAGISGAHLNPAVTLANCMYRGFPWRKFPAYLIGQFLGGMIASAVVYANYLSAINVFEGGAEFRTMKTAVIFCTYPAEFMSTTGQFFSEFIASTLLMFLIYCLKDDGNLGAGILTPLGLFFVIFGIGACFGWETGYAINFARDFGPRLMSFFLGYGTEVFSTGNYYFWVPIVAPFLGCLFGGWLYDTFLFTGESPINTPWMGWMRVLRPTRSKWSSHAAQKEREKQLGLSA